MSESWVAARRCAVALGLDPVGLRPLAGGAGASFGLGEHVLRVGGRLDAEVAAMSAAAEVIPVPRVLERVDLGDCDGLLLQRLPGRPAGELARRDRERAAHAGRACGLLHARLARVVAPAGLRPVPTASARVRPEGLLHLDLHPFNVLVDDEGEVTGVIDWANAAAGDPVLDRARTWSILTLDPTVRRRGDDGWAAMSDAWLTAGGLMDLPDAARAWAADFMLGDLARRCSAAELEPVRRARDAARATVRANPLTGRKR